MSIHKTAVIGAGTMGSQIAAQMANGGAEVVLLDIVPKGANDRSKLAKEALEKMKKSGRAFTHPSHAEQITPGNLEDDLDQLSDAEWIVEAIVEDLDIKQDLYSKLNGARKKGAILSSNTSTLPLAQLKKGLPKELQACLCITHFFNPPRQMRLLELVTDGANDNERLKEVRHFLENRMGKTIVPTKDTPGFIANRIGIFWMMWGLEQALKQGIPVELADSLLGKPLGFPKTGIFGLMDLVGLDLMLDITRSLQDHLPGDDPYQQLDQSISLLKEMVDNDQTGNKGDGGFYRKRDDGSQVFDLKKKAYRDLQQPEDEAIEVAKNKGLHAALETDSKGGRYAWSVLSEMLRYVASLIPEIAEDIPSVDTALTLGFNWRQGPFAMIDALGNPRIYGANWFTEALKEDEKDVPEILKKAAEAKGFYQAKDTKCTYLSRDTTYQAIHVPEDAWQLADKTRGKSPVIENEAAKLWDIGDGIACLQLITPFDVMGNATFDLVEQTTQKVKLDFQGLMIGDDDRQFSAGLNLKKVLKWCEAEDWQAIESILKRGQQSWMTLKYASFPVVCCAYGKALGGACELMLHADCIQAHIESHIGLVEVGIGVVPSWGGCKEMLMHQLKDVTDTGSQLQAVQQVFSRIADARPSASAEEAKDWRILRDCCGISMNRAQVLADAKALCLQKAHDYTPPQSRTLELPKGAARHVFENEIERRVEKDSLDRHAKRVLQSLAFVLSGGDSSPKIMQQLELEVIEERQDDSDVTDAISEQTLLDLERKAFMALIKSGETQTKIKEVL